MTPEEENQKLKEENERLRQTIKQLRQQLDAYQRQAKRAYAHEYDSLPYDEDDRR